ncbi:MAG: hypothetical protein FJ100_10595 [Deltaproteobacteria bacterium]|nr:hypothetical protein [Deltaproteobacteria bacterium]
MDHPAAGPDDPPADPLRTLALAAAGWASLIAAASLGATAPTGLGIAPVAVAVAAAAVGMRSLRTQNATGWAVGTAVLAQLAAAWTLAGVAGPRMGDPLRASMHGIGPLACLAVAGPGLLALVRAPSPIARALATLGSAGLWIFCWMPVGHAGQTRVPWLAALGSVPSAAAAGEAPVASEVIGAPWLAVLAVVSTAVLVGMCARPAWPAAWAWAATSGLGLGVVGAASEGGLVAALATGGALLATCIPLYEVMVRRPADRPDAAAVGRAFEPWAVVLLLATWSLLKANGLRYSTTDEALYYYAARLWSEGAMPYRDFFFSHPPLHIAVPALLYKVFGYQFLMGKLLSVVAATVAALFNWRIARHALGPLGGVLALALTLLAGEVLQAATNLTGVNLTAAWLMAGLWALWVRRSFVWAGACLGAAAATGFYAFGGWLTAMVLALLLPWPARWTDLGQWLRHPAARVAAGFLLVWGGVNLLFGAIGGQAYWDGVYAYHFAKKAKVDGFVPLSEGPTAVLANFATMLGARDFAVSVYHHAAHYWLALGLPLALVARHWVSRQGDAKQAPWSAVFDPRRWWDGPGMAIALVWALALALLVEFGQFKERYDFYFALVLPVVATCAAGFLVVAAEVAGHAVGAAAVAPTRRAVVATVALGAFGWCWMPVDMAANRAAYPSEFAGPKVEGKGPGERLVFEWLPAPGPPWVSTWTQALLWKDHRIRGSVETGMHHYLWGKKRWFSKAEEMAAYIAAHSRPDETITGASDYAPLLALLSGRRMAGNHVDTNSKVFNTGAVALEKFWDDVCRDKLKFIVSAPQSYFAAQDLPKRTTVQENFVRDKVFADPALKHWRPLELELWVRKGPEPCAYKGKRGGGPSL